MVVMVFIMLLSLLLHCPFPPKHKQNFFRSERENWKKWGHTTLLLERVSVSVSLSCENVKHYSPLFIYSISFHTSLEPWIEFSVTVCVETATSLEFQWGHSFSLYLLHGTTDIQNFYCIVVGWYGYVFPSDTTTYSNHTPLRIHNYYTLQRARKSIFVLGLIYLNYKLSNYMCPFFCGYMNYISRFYDRLEGQFNQK